MPNSLKCRLKGLVRKGLLSEKDLSRIYTDNDLVEEFEKIKSEIINCFSQENDIDSDAYNHALDIAISIVHDHISELKGEQK